MKSNNIYTYKENGNVEIVRLLDVYKNNHFLYCTLYFFKEGKITTVSQILKPDDYMNWQIMDNIEFDEIMSIKLWQEVSEQDELLEFDFGK